MGTYLQDHPPARRQFYCPRRDNVLASGTVVLHTAENTPDTVAFDGGAEAVAGFIQRRDTPGSYHRLADSDSVIELIPPECEAFGDGTGTNRWSYHVSGATRADVWPLAPEAWRVGCVRNMAAASADFARWIRTKRGIIVPPRHITVAQARARVPGFVLHGELDPGRRSDPWLNLSPEWQAKLWAQFLAEFARLVGAPAPKPPPPPPRPVPTTGRTVTVDLPELRRGRGPAGSVESLQSLLNGKAGKQLRVDGDFGERTEAAVQDAQRVLWPKDRRQWDGIVGQKTWAALLLL